MPAIRCGLHRLNYLADISRETRNKHIITLGWTWWVFFNISFPLVFFWQAAKSNNKAIVLIAIKRATSYKKLKVSRNVENAHRNIKRNTSERNKKRQWSNQTQTFLYWLTYWRGCTEYKECFCFRKWLMNVLYFYVRQNWINFNCQQHKSSKIARWG